jgi:hypothetical protein
MCAFYSTEQLAHAAGVQSRTVRDHLRFGWLRGEKAKGVNGWRVPVKEAKSWLAIHFPTVPVAKLDEPLPPKPEWRTPMYEADKAHLVRADGSTPCGVKASQWAPYDPEIAHKCKRCAGHDKKGKK